MDTVAIAKITAISVFMAVYLSQNITTLPPNADYAKGGAFIV